MSRHTDHEAWIFGGTTEIQKEIIAAVSAFSLAWHSTKPVLPVSHTMLDKIRTGPLAEIHAGQCRICSPGPPGQAVAGPE